MTRTIHVSRRLLAVAIAVGVGLALLPAAPAAGREPADRVGLLRHARLQPGHLAGGAGRHRPAVGLRRDLARDRDAPRVSSTSRGSTQQVAAARANGARVLLVLGQTPRFHATKPASAASYGARCRLACRAQAAWTNYVSKVVRRYKGRGVDYQVWNEANVSGYWQGTPAQMAKLTQWTSKDRQQQRLGRQGGRAGSRDPAVEPASVAAHVLRAAHRRQEGRGVRRRRRR